MKNMITVLLVSLMVVTSESRLLRKTVHKGKRIGVSITPTTQTGGSWTSTSWTEYPGIVVLQKTAGRDEAFDTFIASRLLVRIITMKLAVVASLFSYAAAFAPSGKPAFSTQLSMAKNIQPKLAYVDALAIEDLPDKGKATGTVVAGLAICIAVDQSGKIYALGDKCPPVNQPLSACKVCPDGTIQDPVLGTKFSLTSGDVVEWCNGGIGKLVGGIFEPVGVPVYAVKTTKDAVQVQVDVNAKLAYEANYWSGILDAQGKADGKYY